MNNQLTITVETVVHTPLEHVWECWTKPEHITKWAFASDDWEAPYAENDLRVDGKFKTTMSAKDKSVSFDFNGTYTLVEKPHHIEYDIEDGRHVSIQFSQISEGVKIIETFNPEHENPEDLQKAGWGAILENFKKYAENLLTNN